MVFFGFTTIWSFAIFPIRRSPFSLSATTEGRTRFPRSVGTTLGIRFRTEATRVLVVPRSIPTMRGFSDMGGVEPSTLLGEPSPSNTPPRGGFLTSGHRRSPWGAVVLRLLPACALLVCAACATTRPGVPLPQPVEEPTVQGDPAASIETRWRVVATARRMLGQTY